LNSAVASASNARELRDALSARFPGVEIKGLDSQRSDVFPDFKAKAVHFAEQSSDFEFGDLRSISLSVHNSGKKSHAGGWVQFSYFGRGNKITLNVGAHFTQYDFDGMLNDGDFRAPRGADVHQYTATHEMGHLLHTNFGPEEADALSARVQAVLGEDNSVANGDVIREGLISKYAASNVYEMVAEAFVMTRLYPDMASRIEKRIHDLLMEMYERNS
jgi:hypothetical protein